ncbi:hypothetical protein [Marinibacterium profundimaris]|uniref:Uncharacterized protein n=1 Tax=Marinibacterium profundimaris TaxID=1679460 RepID=A0A225NH93_9RHOB|nr:hypothetical protein [Marinibacterium profundimaris]OWU66785.1 hypothetical protein ATO3_27365 [Marinibacterium profundimaris]
MIWLIRYLFYLLRRILYLLYQLLVFISKPAARWLLPLAIIGLAGWQADPLLEVFALPSVTMVLQQWIPLPPNETELYAVTTLLAVIVGLIMLSVMLRWFLGAFPPLRKPLPPLRRLRVRNFIKRPVPVSVAVPPLKHAFQHQQQEQWAERLPPAVQSVLQASQRPTEALGAVLAVPPALSSSKAEDGPLQTLTEAPASKPQPAPSEPAPMPQPEQPAAPQPRKPEAADDWKKRVPPRNRKQVEKTPQAAKRLETEILDEPEH